MSARRFGRRELLRAAGLTLCVPAFLRDAFAEPPPQASRLMILMQANGTHQASYWPDPTTGSSPILDPLLSNPVLAQKTLLLRGINNLVAGPGNQHDHGFSSLWTGVPPVGTMDDAFGGGPSIDQILKAKLQPAALFPTLNAGVTAADIAPKNGHRRSFSYIAAMQQIPTQIDPYRLFHALFRDASADPAGAARKLAAQRSILDASARDLAALSARLGPKQRDKLDAHATAVREYEARLSASLTANQSCVRPAEPASGLDPTVEDNVPQLAVLMLDLIAVALTCNLTRIVTFPLGISGNQWFYRWLEINRDNHSDIAHQDPDDDSNPAISGFMVQISRWVATLVARLAAQLEATPEENGTALDSTLLIWANENATGSHRLDNLPIALIGRAGGRLTSSGVLDRGAQTHYQLNTSVLHLMGVEAAGYGERPDCGGLIGL